MKPEVTILKVYEDEITEYDFPIYLTGYDPYTDQKFKGSFVYSNGLLKPISYSTTKGEKISKKFISWANAAILSFKEEYYK
ncbi:hypothetical protein J14TS2_45160 [Bacillus sp. J14TS2]|uniref:hypothetical protein n=1 Tax=Bacillus sp. J14TS2 TaxID=2807188 RepID=UPI001B255725|nr:hypothetical protein [Bacillus sp. J14TS2]GIN74041.1 hypothetical protein J14TS2_45160 [Bacillus sp. J14TS2]